jgi:hypothetical protein
VGEVQFEEVTAEDSIVGRVARAIKRGYVRIPVSFQLGPLPTLAPGALQVEALLVQCFETSGDLPQSFVEQDPSPRLD